MEEGTAKRANRAGGRLLQPPVELEAAAVLAEILTTISRLKSPCGVGHSGVTGCYRGLYGCYRVLQCVPYVARILQGVIVCYRCGTLQ